MTYFNPHQLRESPKQQPVEPTSCMKCGNKHVEQFCAANITEFIWKKPATEVFLVGEWSKWQYYQQLKKQPDGNFVLRLNLRIGLYQYKFIVDGKWTYDEDDQFKVPDNHGSFNNLKDVYPRTAYTQNQDFEGPDTKIISTLKEKNLKIIGSWDNWAKQLEMKEVFNHLKNCRQYQISLKLQPGRKYQFKFIADGKYLTDPSYPAISNNFGGFNNLIVVTFGDGQQTPKIQMKKKQPADINAKEWVWQRQKLEDFPYYNIYGHKINIVGDYLYVVGGNDKGCYKNLILKISLDNYVCEEVETFNEEEFPARAYHHAKIYGNKLLIYGGVGNHVILNDYRSYNTTTKQWGVPPKIRGTPPQNRQKNSSILFKDLLIFFGGYLWTQDLQFQYIYNDISILDLNDMVWIQAPEIEGPKPAARYAHTATLFNQYMYVFGGVINPAQIQSTNDVWRLKIATQSKLEWEQIKMAGKAPAPRYGHSASLINHMIAIFAGMKDKLVMYNDLFFLDIKNHAWVHPAVSGQIPRPRCYHHAVTVNDQQIIVLGGKTFRGGKNQNAYILRPDLAPKPLQL